ncbi:MAG: Gfo/Idh/MocA family oxidoreductase [Chloroflexi bacterium]|nr:Gfo/Idh/MocA family oxidoreductase [Chloroflexota bacterium]
MYDIGVVVVGTGFIGPVHIEALRRIGARVVGVCDVAQEKAKQVAQEWGLPKVYFRYEDVLADPDVQMVHLCTPNRLHYGQAKAALQAGKHVLCEKPLAMNSAESAELVALAAKSGRVAAVDYNLRFYPLAIEARNMVQRGDVGEIFSVCGSYVQDWLFYPTDYNWRVLASEGGQLRAIADIGTHWLDLVHYITGLEVESVCADLKTVHPIRQRPTGEVETFAGKVQKIIPTEPVEITTEDHGAVLLRFKGGARGVLWCSQVTAGRKNCLRFELAGSKCALAFESESPNQMWIGHRERANEWLLRDPGLVSEAARKAITYPGGHNEGFPDTLKQAFKALYDYIAAGDYTAPPTYATFADGHREILLCEAILKSHQEQRWVNV